MKKTISAILASAGIHLISAVTLLIAAEPVQLDSALAQMTKIQASELIEHARTISDKQFQGREAGRKGSRRTAEYIIGQFRRWGVQPGGAAGTYFQTFKIETGYRISSSLQFHTSGFSTGDYTRKTDYALLHLVGNKAAVKGELAFAGYGISTKEPGFDEYAGLNVKNKAVVVFTGSPWTGRMKQWPLLDPKDHYKYSGLTYKARNAALHGATCLLVVDNPIGWKASLDANARFRVPDFNSRIDSPIPVVHISLDVMACISGYSKAELAAMAEDIVRDKQPESTPLRGRHMEFNATLSGQAWVGRNIIGIMTGSDPKLKEEAIVIGAHYDHLGREQDSIYFGANDNASGVATLLGTARAFSSGKRPGRTIMFVAFDAEEIGKLGSKFLLKKAVIPLNRIVLMINFDMVGKNGENEINAVATRSSKKLHMIHQNMNRHIGLKLTHPRSYRLGRSDHSPFFEADIPVMYLFGGKDPEYNTPEDTWEKLLPMKLERVSKLAFLTAYYVASLKERIDFSGYQEMEEKMEMQ